MTLTSLAERNWLPDAVIRIGIKQLLRRRLRQTGDGEFDRDRFVEELKASPLAVHTDAANEQHYEAPPEFFRSVLGPRLKYSGCLYPRADTTLAGAEEAMLRLTCERASLADGQRVLELGCGWGSLSLWVAEHYPRSTITAVSNSHRQREFIQGRASTLGLSNLTVVTADMVDYSPEGRFDRVVSVEMFEHMRNYQELFRRVAAWLEDSGKAFAHVFCHAHEPYLFEAEGRDNWMGRHFFTGGVMPSEDLFGCFPNDLRIVRQWRVDGMHYWRTCEDWLANLDRHRDRLLGVLSHDGAPEGAAIALQRWRMFFMACAELFRFEQGRRWFVSHYLFEPTRVASDRPHAPSPHPSTPGAPA